MPAGNPFSPFATDVLLQRYLVEAAPLRQRGQSTSLHAGGVLRGAWRGWQWDLTGTLDAQRRTGQVVTTIDVSAANAAIAAGADPFAPLAPALVADRVVNRTLQITQGAGAKFVATSRPLRLPAGAVTVTATGEAERIAADATTRGGDPFALSFARSRIEGGVAVDVPLASRKEDVLPWAGELSANASAAVRRVGGFGALSDSTLGVSWAPFAELQVLAQLKRSTAAPTLDQLAAPQASAPLVPLFDFGTGRSRLVTLLIGGNPGLAAERRRVRSLGATIKPFAGKELRSGITFEATEIRGGIQTIYAVTPLTQAGLPDLFVRDTTGDLTTVTFRPTNIFRERQQAINLTLAANGKLGRARPAAPGGAPPDRPSFYGGIGPTLRLSDRVQLRPDTAELNLLDGDTLSSGITPRLAGYGYGGINYLGHGATFDFYCTGAARVRGGVAAATLDFAPLCKVNLSGSLSLHYVFPREAWTRQLGLKLEVANATNAQQRVRDGNGTVPFRYQRDLLDPIGRTVTLSLRKLF